MTGISVRAVETAADRKAFLQVPLDVFAGDRNFVPQLFVERAEHISVKKNPFFQHAEAQLFIAERNGKVVGRISAQVNQLHLERYGDATGQFGFIDAIDDVEVFKALVTAAADWLRERGMKRMQGPFSFSINEESGLLVDGFYTPPVVMMPHGLPYFSRHLESCGLRKAKDLIAYNFEGLPEPPRAMKAMERKARKSGDLTTRPISKKNLEQDLDVIIDIFNDAWSDNWNFVPMTKQEISALGEVLKFLVDEDYISIGYYKGEAAAMAVSLPDINGWIKGTGGKLLPFGFAKILWRKFMTPLAAARMALMGVRKTYHGTPVGSALALAVIEDVRLAHKARGVKRAELSWILEDNLAMRNVIEKLGGVGYKTYRIYECDV